MKKFITVMAFQVGLYLLQYIILPLILATPLIDAFETLIVIIPTTVVVSFFGMYLVEDKMRYWLVGIPLHFLLVNLYHPDGQYGIGVGMFKLIIFDIAVLTIIVAITQIGVWIIVKVVKFIQKKQRDKDNERYS